MPEQNLPRNEAEFQRLRLNVQKEQAGTAVGSTLSFTPAFPALALLATRLPSTAKQIGHLFGVAVEPRPGGKPAKVGVSAGAILYLAPAPLGVTPPEVFGLPPDYVGRVFPGLPKTELLATESTLDRNRLFEFQARRAAIEALARSASVTTDPRALRQVLLIAALGQAQYPGLRSEFQGLRSAATSQLARLEGKYTPTSSLPAGLELTNFARKRPPHLRQQPPPDGPNALGSSALQSTNPADP